VNAGHSKDHTMHYPAVVQFTGDDELEIIQNQNELDQFIGNAQLPCSVIDHNGAIFTITRVPNDKFSIINTNSYISHTDAVSMAQRHMAALDQCCVAKFNAATVTAVINAIVALDQQ